MSKLLIPPMSEQSTDKKSVKAQLEQLVKDGDEIAKKLPPFTPLRRRGGALSE